MVRELIRLEDVHRAFGAVTVLDGINLRIEEGDRIGVVGHNGAGKTTLLRTISDQNQDVGDITFAPGLRIAYLTQVRDIDEDATLEQELNRRGHQFKELEEEIASIEAKMAEPSFYEEDWQPVIERYSELQALSARSGGSDVAGHAKNILNALELGHHPLDMPLAKLSGGERAKVALARQLVGLGEIDVFFLDEPTNHLDLPTLQWLETFLTKFRGAQLIVSHDRFFLDRICTHILEIHDGHTRGYAGNYTAFLQQKVLFLQTLDDRISKCEKEIKRLTGALQSMKRANKFDKSISQKHKMLSRSQRELKWLKTLKPSERRELQFDLQSTEKSSLDVLDFRNASLKFEGLQNPILNKVEIGVRRGQKIGIVGANGAGKTTLLRIINGEIELDEGVIDVRPGVEIGYFHQDHRTLDFDLTPIEQVQKLKPRMEYAKIRAMLGQFQFTPEMVSTQLNKLSGGERARIAMLKLLLEDNNLLLLDEPTNHLDTDAKEALEETLNNYDGCILTVSHDRWFLDKVCDTIWELPGDGTIRVYPGNYSDYILRKSKA
ncbi:MAG: ABC-F family ATP-binding cassette domain-containing protein [Candidatus Thalassarchaeaceae archaeon]|nr:ABC-F family ATP-binding cassette domain-containing protein [Candidatus Thalassarchaeaceae archaeon]